MEECFGTFVYTKSVYKLPEMNLGKILCWGYFRIVKKVCEDKAGFCKGRDVQSLEMLVTIRRSLKACRCTADVCR